MSYETAKAAFADWGVDTEAALDRLKTIPISMHCWQGDDVVGFEQKSGSSGGGIQATGNHPGRARTPDELRADLEFAYSMIPGQHRLLFDHRCISLSVFARWRRLYRIVAMSRLWRPWYRALHLRN